MSTLCPSHFPGSEAVLTARCLSLAASRKSLTYFNHDSRAALQEVTFDLQEVKKVFFGSFHKVSYLPEPPDPCPLCTQCSLEHQTLTLRSLCPSRSIFIWAK